MDWIACSVNGALRKRVAGALQADDQTVADELTVARAAQRRDVLDADRGAGRAPRGTTEQKQRR